MFITKCDVCKKEIKGESVLAGYGFSRKHFCLKCGKPILDFLRKLKNPKGKSSLTT